jgi:hypothetical protein
MKLGFIALIIPKLKDSHLSGLPNATHTGSYPSYSLDLVSSDFLCSPDLKYPKGKETSESARYNPECNMGTE